MYTMYTKCVHIHNIFTHIRVFVNTITRDDKEIY